MVTRLQKNSSKTINRLLKHFGLRVVRDGKPNLSRNRKACIENLTVMADILDAYNCSWWISHGTFLGGVRNGDFIPHDTDLDISLVFSEAFIPAYYEIINEFCLRRVLGFTENSLELTFVRNGITVDLFFVYEEGNKFRHSAFANFTQWQYDRYDYFFSPVFPVEFRFLGADLKAPKNAERFLTEFYGKNWQIPIKQWEYYSDPSNVQFSGFRYCKPEAEANFLSWVGERT